MNCKIIIVAGVARGGKSVLANRLCEVGYNRIPGDALISTAEKLFPESGIRHQGDDRETAKAFYPFLLQFTQKLEDESQPFVIDTAKLLPEDAADLMAKAAAQVAFLGYPHIDPASKLADIRRFANPIDWTRGVPDDTMKSMIDGISKWAAVQEQECERYRVPYYDTGSNFTHTLDRAFISLADRPVSHLRRRLPALRV